MSTMVADIASTRASARRIATRRDRPPAESRVAVRLTRRGRLVLVLALLVVAVVTLTVVSAPAASTGETHHPPAQTVVVRPGQTLWDIATSVAPGEDPRDVVARIVDLNSLSDAGSIRIGQPLDVPRS